MSSKKKKKGKVIATTKTSSFHCKGAINCVSFSLSLLSSIVYRKGRKANPKKEYSRRPLFSPFASIREASRSPPPPPPTFSHFYHTAFPPVRPPARTHITALRVCVKGPLPLLHDAMSNRMAMGDTHTHTQSLRYA